MFAFESLSMDCDDSTSAQIHFYGRSRMKQENRSEEIKSHFLDKFRGLHGVSSIAPSKVGGEVVILALELSQQ